MMRRDREELAVVIPRPALRRAPSQGVVKDVNFDGTITLSVNGETVVAFPDASAFELRRGLPVIVEWDDLGGVKRLRRRR